MVVAGVFGRTRTGRLSSWCLVGALLLSACADDGSSTVTVGNQTATSERATESTQPTPVPEPTPTTLLESAGQPLTERPSAVWVETHQAYAGFLYRQFLQNPQQAAWGPDGALYVADGGGRHIVKVSPYGSMEDLGIWQTNRLMAERGPQPLAIDSEGTLYFGVASTLFRRSPDGTLEELSTFPNGELLSFDIDADGTLFFSLNSGSIYRWVEDGPPETIAEGYNQPNIAVGPNGVLYINVYQADRIMVMDLATGETGLFAEGMAPIEGCYLNVDADGDLWARCTWSVYQFGPDGEVKPYVMDGMTMPDDRFNFHLGGGFDFDEQGNLYVTDGTGTIIRLNKVEGQGEDVFTSEYIYHAFEASDLDVAPDGTVYSDRLIPGEFWRFGTEGTAEIVLEQEGSPRSGVAVDSEGTPFFSHAQLGIVALRDGTVIPYADMQTPRMIFGSDGYLYAVDGEFGQSKAIVRIGDPGDREVFITEVDGMPLGTMPVHLARSRSGGLYVLTEENCNLYEVDLEGNSVLINDIAPMCQFSIMASSPVIDRIYWLAHDHALDSFPHRYSLYEFEPAGELSLISPQIPGDPWAMGVSPTGEWLYVAEVGAINKIPLVVP